MKICIQLFSKMLRRRTRSDDNNVSSKALKNIEKEEKNVKKDEKNIKKEDKTRKTAKPKKKIQILGFVPDTKILTLAIQFEHDTKVYVVTADTLRRNYPIELIDFLEKHIEDK